MGVPVITILAAAQTEAGTIVTFSAGCGHGGSNTSGFAAAIAAAAAADIVLFVGGDSGGLGWNKNTCGEDDDRADLDLPGVQSDLLDALLLTGTPLVLVLVHGRPVTFVKHQLASRLDTILAAWRPGCEGILSLPSHEIYAIQNYQMWRQDTTSDSASIYHLISFLAFSVLTNLSCRRECHLGFADGPRHTQRPPGPGMLLVLALRPTWQLFSALALALTLTT